MSDDDHVVRVFEGDLQDATFLVSLLESGGISTRLVSAVRATRWMSGQASVFVLSSDANDARACVEDFKRNGKRKAD